MKPAQLRSCFQAIRVALLLGLVLAGGEACPSPAQQTPSAPASKEATSRADSQEMTKDILHLRGHAEITYQDMKLTADDVTYNQTTGDLEARGHVLLVDTQSHLAADEVHYNLRTKKGWFVNAQGFVHSKVSQRTRMLTTTNPFYVKAARVDRLDEDTYLVQRGRLTTCECAEKGWSIAARRANVEVDNRAVMHDAVFRLLSVPILFTPVMVNSIARMPRQTGFLLPQIGNSTQKGVILGDGFLWSINPSADLLLGFWNYSIRGPAWRGQFHAMPDENSEIYVDSFGVDDRGGGPNREAKAPGQSLRAIGETRDLGYGFRGVVNVDYVSSLAFRETFTDTFNEAVSSEARQTGFLTKNFDADSLNLYVSRYQNFLSATQFVPGSSAPAGGTSTVCGPGISLSACAVSIRETPSVSFDGMDKQIGQTPFYFSFDASAGGVGRTQPELELPTISERLDFHPQLTLRVKPFWGFHLTPSMGAEATRYGTSLDPTHDPLNRLLGEFSLDLRPPSFEKVFARKYAGRRLKHVIEPDIQYQLVRLRHSEDIADVVRYDALDIFAQTNDVEYSLTNTIFARKDAPEGSTDTPQAQEILSLRISQKYYFDPTFGHAFTPGVLSVFEPTISLTGFAFDRGQQLSPVVSVLKLAPFSNYDTELRADLNPSGGGVLNAGITSHIHRGPLGLAFTDFFINRTATLVTPVTPANPMALPSFHLFRTVATYGNVNRKGFSGAVGLDYNFALKIANQVVGQLGYNFGCFSLDTEVRRFNLGPLRVENQYRVALSLANVGTFGNLKRRERLY